MKFQITTCPFDLKRLQKEVNILLISDLHYDQKKETASGVSGMDINSALLKGITDMDDDWFPDIVVVAGDLVNTNQPEGYTSLKDLLTKLTTRFPNLRHTVFFAPGNHDVDRKKQKQIRKILKELSGECFPSCSERFKWESTIRKLRKKIGNLLYKISKIEVGDRERKLFSQYEKTYFPLYLSEQDVMRKKPDGFSLLASVEVTPVMEGIETTFLKSLLGVTVVSHNSSFFCNIGSDRDDRNFLFLIKSFVEKINDLIPSDGPVISFMHHPFYLLNDSEHIGPATHDSSGDKNNNFTKILDHSDLVLSGHVHGILHDPTFLLNRAYMITNGTSFTTDHYIDKFHPYTFGVIKVNKLLRKFALKKRRYRTTVEPGINWNGFQAENEEKFEFFTFANRLGIESTSLESERVRILHYFASLPGPADPQKEIRFLSYQLSLLNDSFRSDKSITCDVIEFRDTFVQTDAILFNLAHEKSVCVYKIEGIDNLVDAILNIIAKKKSEKIPKDCQVYFAVSRKALVDPKGVPYVKLIDALREDHNDLILLSKIDYVSINLLYY